MYIFLNPIDALEPGKLQRSSFISKFRNKSFASFFTHYFAGSNFTAHLYIFSSSIDIADFFYFRFINMAIREMFKQIFKRKNIQLFFQQISF